MILQCPLCRSQYRLQTSAEGKKVKCKQCTHVWTAHAQDFIEELEQVALPRAVGDYSAQAQRNQNDINKTPRPSFTQTQAEVVTLKSEKTSDEGTNILPPRSEPTPEPQVSEILPNITPEPLENGIDSTVQPEITDESFVEKNDVPELPPLESREYPRQKPAIDPDRETRPRFEAKHIQKEKRSSLIGLSVVILLVGVFFVSVLMGRNQIVKHWPAAALMYDVVGLHVPVIGEGLRFENIRTSYDTNVEGEQIILLQGEIKNFSSETRSVPLVAIKPFEETNKILAKAKVKIENDSLKAGEVTKFTSEVPATTKLNPQDKFVFIDG